MSDLTVAIIQPGYLPWLGYFDQWARADLFVHYDDVQFTRKSWRTRNQILGPEGAEWLTVPVIHYGEARPINQVEVAAGDWAKRHMGVLRDRYRRAPFAAQYLDDLESMLVQPWKRLVDLDVSIARLLAAWLGIGVKECFASDLDIPVDLDTTARPLQICQKLGARRFIVGPTAKAYINPKAFQEAGIELVWHEYVPQETPSLSALHAVLNLGPAARGLIGSAGAR